MSLKLSKYDTFEYKQFTIQQKHAAMKVGTDSDLLGTLSQGGTHILDIGTGTGILSLMLAQRYPNAHITAIEIDTNAVIDAKENFTRSPFHDRISLQHIDFKDFLLKAAACSFDSIVCNPPYFDKSLECPTLGRTRARHSSSLPFPLLIKGAYSLLENDGLFSVCIPPEVLPIFNEIALNEGFQIQTIYHIQTLPHKPPKRFVPIFKKGNVTELFEYHVCMRNADGSRSPWYLEQLKDFLIVQQ